jgi:hypothetical protein
MPQQRGGEAPQHHSAAGLLRGEPAEPVIEDEGRVGIVDVAGAGVGWDEERGRHERGHAAKNRRKTRQLSSTLAF